jgi:hypothetical protein
MAIEFEAAVENGVIRIPEAYREAAARFSAPLCVTLEENRRYTEQNAPRSRIIPRKGSGPITEANFTAMKIDTRNWKFNREEANER